MANELAIERSALDSANSESVSISHEGASECQVLLHLETRKATPKSFSQKCIEITPFKPYIAFSRQTAGHY